MTALDIFCTYEVAFTKHSWLFTHSEVCAKYGLMMEFFAEYGKCVRLWCLKARFKYLSKCMYIYASNIDDDPQKGVHQG